METGYASLRIASIFGPLDHFGKLRASRLVVNNVSRALVTGAAHRTWRSVKGGELVAARRLSIYIFWKV